MGVRLGAHLFSGEYPWREQVCAARIVGNSCGDGNELSVQQNRTADHLGGDDDCLGVAELFLGCAEFPVLNVTLLTVTKCPA